ncbi:hypothetical protein [Escherichia albertii]|uniref:hypothetical protein n=1 Tax=Escherichia albertii TaxID=208962 RepID=UPI000BF46C08|nr:hypothetical protein [Escherichia albertii]PFF96635.1 hypothetical protein CRH02_06830 [Escherichia albertii]
MKRILLCLLVSGYCHAETLRCDDPTVIRKLRDSFVKDTENERIQDEYKEFDAYTLVEPVVTKISKLPSEINECRALVEWSFNTDSKLSYIPITYVTFDNKVEYDRDLFWSDIKKAQNELGKVDYPAVLPHNPKPVEYLKLKVTPVQSESITLNTITLTKFKDVEGTSNTSHAQIVINYKEATVQLKGNACDIKEALGKRFLYAGYKEGTLYEFKNKECLVKMLVNNQETEASVKVTGCQSYCVTDKPEALSGYYQNYSYR